MLAVVGGWLLLAATAVVSVIRIVQARRESAGGRAASAVGCLGLTLLTMFAALFLAVVVLIGCDNS